MTRRAWHPNRSKPKANAVRLNTRLAKFRVWQDEAAVHNCVEHAVRGDDGVLECDECGAQLRAV